MMTFSPINDQVYEETGTQILYCKLFPLILEDFITRDDAAEMMKASNLPVNTDVIVNPGQAVSVVDPAGTGSTVSPAKGSGSGRTSPIYNGTYLLPADEVKAKQKEALKNSGGVATGKILDTSLGK